MFLNPAWRRKRVTSTSREAQPQVGVQLARFFVVVPQQVQHHDPAAGLQNPPRLRHRALGMLRVMQRLAEERQIHRAHLGSARPPDRLCDTPDSSRRACAPARRRTPPSFPSCPPRSPSSRAAPATAKTCLRPRPDRRSPSAASAPATSPPGPSTTAPARSCARTCPPARRNTRASCPAAAAAPAAALPNPARPRESRPPPRRSTAEHLRKSVRLGARCFSRYRMLLPLRRSSTNPACFNCDRVRGDTALTHAEDLLQLGHGKLLALHQQQDAEAAGIGQQPQVFED